MPCLSAQEAGKRGRRATRRCRAAKRVESDDDSSIRLASDLHCDCKAGLEKATRFAFVRLFVLPAAQADQVTVTTFFLQKIAEDNGRHEVRAISDGRCHVPYPRDEDGNCPPNETVTESICFDDAPARSHSHQRRARRPLMALP